MTAPPHIFPSKLAMDDYREQSRLNRLRNPVQFSDHIPTDQKYAKADWVDDRNKLLDYCERHGLKSYRLTANQRAKALGK